MKNIFFAQLIIITMIINSPICSQEIPQVNDLEQRNNAMKEFVKHRLENGTPLEILHPVLQTIRNNTREAKAKNDYSDRENYTYDELKNNNCLKGQSNPKSNCNKLRSEYNQRHTKYTQALEEYKATPEYKAANIIDRAYQAERYGTIEDKQKLLDLFLK